MRTNVQTNTKNYYLYFQHLNFISFEFICVKFHLRCKMQKLVSILSGKLLKKIAIHKQIHILCALCIVNTPIVVCTIYNAIKIQLSLFTKWECVCVCVCECLAACSRTRTSDQNYKGEQFLLSS